MKRRRFRSADTPSEEDRIRIGLAYSDPEDPDTKRVD